MSFSSPKYKITRGTKGWQKRIRGQVEWIASFKEAPTPADVDRIYEERLALPDGDPRKIRLSKPKQGVNYELEAVAKFLERTLARIDALETKVMELQKDVRDVQRVKWDR
ncbi:MAG TPA: hypothetical protein VH370_07980 [Humisphaera sp.]|jgi:hypothetical protein|nr:hypothetical protein [Humisphaera sp.]